MRCSVNINIKSFFTPLKPDNASLCASSISGVQKLFLNLILLLKNIASLILVTFFFACVPFRGKILLKLKLYLTTYLKLHKLHYTKLTGFNLIFAPP